MKLYVKTRRYKTQSLLEGQASQKIYGTLNGSDISLLQILQSLKNENDCVSGANTPPRIEMSTAGVINTSSNEAAVENKIENHTVVTKVSPSVSLGRVGNDGRLKGYFSSYFQFKP